MSETRRRLVAPVWTPSTESYEARCPDCGKLAFFVTAEYVVKHSLLVPVVVPHDCEIEKEVNGL